MCRSSFQRSNRRLDLSMDITPETEDFIRIHRDSDVRRLALSAGKPAGVDLQFAFNQIEGRQTARRKLPAWYDVDGIVYPPHLNMEQCSSEETAEYKAGLALPVAQDNNLKNVLIDITGGFGVDFSFMSRRFDRAVYIEKNADLCEIASRNFRLLGLGNVDVVNQDSVEFLSDFHSGTETFVTVFADPARRDVHGRKMVSISDCEPDVLSLFPIFDSIADRIILKLSPMLDWHEAVREIDSAGSRTTCGFKAVEVHAVAVKNECKELLIIIEPSNSQFDDVKEPVLRLVCASNRKMFSCLADDVMAQTPLAEAASLVEGLYLYEPNAAVMKIGCFAAIASQYNVKAVGHNSHLFVSSEFIEDFPGRKFEITAVSSMNKKEVRKALRDIRQANVAVRNFPMRAEELRRRLKVSDGGDAYIFGTTVTGGQHVLIITKKIS